MKMQIEQINLENNSSSKLLNEFNLNNSASSTVNAKKGENQTIETLATQITQRINDILKGLSPQRYGGVQF
jgi:hypothetical protein